MGDARYTHTKVLFLKDGRKREVRFLGNYRQEPDAEHPESCPFCDRNTLCYLGADDKGPECTIVYFRCHTCEHYFSGPFKRRDAEAFKTANEKAQAEMARGLHDTVAAEIDTLCAQFAHQLANDLVLPEDF